MNEAIEMAKRLLVDSIWKSANLEGLGTTFPKTEAILENLPVETSRNELLFIINMKKAWEFLLDNIDYSNCFVFLRELNKLVGANDLIYDSGKIRTINVTIGGTSWASTIPVESEVLDNIENLNKIKDVELKALKYFCYVTRTQIFIDGNKRVAQLMANKVLIENNIGIFQIPVELLEDFKSLLLNYYETNDDEDIVKFMKEYCIVRVGKQVSLKKMNIDNL